MRLLTVLFFFLLSLTSLADKKTIGIYVHYPIADPECADSLKKVLDKEYNVVFLKHKTLTSDNLNRLNLIAFPGDLGDSDKFDDLLLDKKYIIQNYINNGGAYLGICMGAYFAGHYYFDILKEIDTVRYVKRPFADIEREDETIAKIKWNYNPYRMYFFDGCAIIGNPNKMRVISTYMNNDPMAAIQGKIGLIGCHPESFKDWYVTKEMKPHWHNEEHHKLLLDFVNELLK